MRLSNDDFLSLRNGNVRLVKYNSSTSNLDYYSLFHDGSGNYSFAFDSDQSAPAVFSPAASIPVFSDVSTFSPGTVQPTFQYSGTDGGSYVLVPYAIGGPRTYRLDTGETS